MKKDTLIAAIVPLALIVGVLYSGSMDSPTGFAAAEAKKAYGAYYLDPSFKIRFGYEMKSEYESAAAKARAAVEQCKAQKKIGECLSQYVKSNGVECERNDIEDIFYGILSQYEECLKLEEEEAVCRLSALREAPGERFKKIYEILARSLVNEVSFELRDSGSPVIEDAIGSPGAYYTDSERKETKTSSASIKLDYRDEPKIDSITSSDGRALSATILYKKGGKVYFVEKSAENNFLLQKGIRKISLPRKNAAKFCIKSGRQVSAFDSIDNEAKARDVVYRFAVKYPELDTPPPVTALEAADKLKAENSVIISWGRARWEDGRDAMNIEHYNLYCSESEFKRNDKGEIEFEGMAPVKVFSDINPEQWKAGISKCGNNDIEDGKAYYFAVTSATQEAESIAAISKSAVPADDLAPGIAGFTLTNNGGATAESADGSACIQMSGSINAIPRRVEYNEDRDSNNGGTVIRNDERLEYLLHYSKTAVANNLDICEPKKCRKISIAQPASFNSNDDAGDEKFADGQDYCFTLAAKDGLGNIIKNIISPYEFAIPEQWNGIKSFRME